MEQIQTNDLQDLETVTQPIKSNADLRLVIYNLKQEGENDIVTAHSFIAPHIIDIPKYLQDYYQTIAEVGNTSFTLFLDTYEVYKLVKEDK